MSYRIDAIAMLDALDRTPSWADVRARNDKLDDETVRFIVNQAATFAHLLTTVEETLALHNARIVSSNKQAKGDTDAISS